ncbi:MAG: ABC transporter ATP-binding protein [Lachnospiraceae bacterium]|nr:ABC transporter ATP-binding protein [Lachnospiraceae bacterium]
MIQVENLTMKYTYGPSFLVPHATFLPGEIATVIGRNGSGKSTFLRALAGQMPYEGSIRIGEKELKTLNPIERARQIAFLPQNVNVAHLSVKMLVEHGRYPYHGNVRRLNKEDDEHVERALFMAGLSDLSGRELGELSGGEQRRAFLAMVIAQNTPMILLDEPTTYMDHRYQEDFYEVLKKLAGEGKGIVMVCHDIVQSFTYSDRIFLMQDRCLSEGMTPEELAKEEACLRENFGAVMKKDSDPKALYRYTMKR